MKKDIDLKELIKIVSDIENKYQQKDVIMEENQKSKIDIEQIFKTDMPIFDKLNQLKLFEQQYPIRSVKDLQDLFYEEAKVLENVSLYEDYYNNFYSSVGIMSNMDSYMSYKKLSVLELKRYLTWRTKLRKGVFTFTNSKFIYIYVNELFRQIGLKNKEEGFDILMFMLDNLIMLSPRNENIFKRIVLEYIYVFDIDINNTLSFELFKQLFIPNNVINCDIKKNDQVSEYLFNNFGSNNLFFINNSSEIKEILDKVVINIDKYLTKNNESILSLLYKEKNNIVNYDFYMSLIPLEEQVNIKANKIILLNKMYKIVFNKNNYYITEYVLENKYNLIIRYFINLIENRLRKKYGERLLKEKKFPEIKKESSFDDVITSSDLIKIIDQTIKNFLYKKVEVKKEIKIDFSKLENIRNISNEVSEKLITDFDKEEEIIKPVVLKVKEQKTNNIYLDFINNLDDIQKTFLSDLINQVDFKQIKLYLEEHNILLEVMCESINEIANEILFDNILEIQDDEIIIYDEYLDNLKESLGGK